MPSFCTSLSEGTCSGIFAFIKGAVKGTLQAYIAYSQQISLLFVPCSSLCALLCSLCSALHFVLCISPCALLCSLCSALLFVLCISLCARLCSLCSSLLFVLCSALLVLLARLAVGLTNWLARATNTHTCVGTSWTHTHTHTKYPEHHPGHTTIRQ